MLKVFLFILAIAFLIFVFFSFKAPEAKNIIWGVNFSQTQAEALGLNWKETYRAIIEDLGADHIKLLTQWDKTEPSRNVFSFEDIDWQIQEAKGHDIKIIYVLGMKTGRWPECHLPSWASLLSKKEQQENLLQYIQEVVSRYKNDKAIVAWQAENEPLFKFGECPWHVKDFLVQEIKLIKSLDQTRPVIVSDSGEQSFWWKAANLGDIVGTTLYRKVWVHLTDSLGFYADIPLPPSSYWLKSKLIKKIFDKKVINVELQAEPWTHKFLSQVPLKEQEKTMNLEKFQANIRYARQTGLSEFYFWGGEWWYWLKENQNKPEIWEEAKKLFYSK